VLRHLSAIFGRQSHIAVMRDLSLRVMFLGAFAKLRKAIICFMLVGPVRMEQLDSHSTDFYEIWYLKIFLKSVKII
jgi:hypothetical protein